MGTESLGSKLRKARIDAGVKITHIVQGGNTSSTALYFWEHDKRVPSEKSVEMLKRYFDISHLESEIKAARLKRANVFVTPEQADWKSTQTIIESLGFKYEYQLAIQSIKDDDFLMHYPAWQKVCTKLERLVSLLDAAIVSFYNLLEKEEENLLGSSYAKGMTLVDFNWKPFELKYRSHQRGNTPKAKINRTSWRIKSAMSEIHKFVGDQDEQAGNNSIGYKTLLNKSRDIYDLADSISRTPFPRKVWENDFTYSYTYK